jgi:redox-sensitive bicupin YhaK (pirin superfamily)
MTTTTATTPKTAIGTDTVLKDVVHVRAAPGGHWVGDGFPVRTMFGYDNPQVSPFLLLDYAGPHQFTPSSTPRGVGEHPHRGFETVTIVYSGEVEHRDSAGGGGRIGPSDVQWMTAGSGLVHEEMHSPEFTQSGGTFEAVQLWVNLPARLKMTPPKYQTILNADIPEIALGDGGSLRVIAGAANGAKGPADTFTPVELWDVRLKAGHGTVLELPEGHMGAIMVMSGTIIVNGSLAREAEFVLLDRKGQGLRIDAQKDAKLLILGGEPLDEPVFGYGPFVMNTREEIIQAANDFNAGKMGRLSPK